MHQSSVAESDEKHFVSLSVQRISKEPGARIVHYFLDDSDGVPNLAVVGMEQRSRHMSYAVTERFIELAGLDKSEFSAARWKSKRAVVTWLKGFIQNPRDPPSSSGANPIIQSPPGHGKEIFWDADITEAGNFKGGNVKSIVESLVPAGDIVWLGGFTTCGKRLQHYRSFQRNGVTISVNSFIYILSISGGDNLIAYIEDLYEDNKLQKKMKVRWLHKRDEIKCDIPAPVPHAREVFMTPFREVYLLECCNGEVSVLSWDHFQQCMLSFPTYAAQAYVCRRSFGPDVKSFDICNVIGYWRQNILSMAEISSCALASDSAVVHKGERASIAKRGFKAPRSSRKRFGKLVPRPAGGFSMQDTTSPLSHDMVNAGVGNNMDMLSTSEREFARPGEEVELLSEDSGLRGCWHRCTVLEEHLGKVNLRFEDILDVDGSGLLEEWHALGKVAGPDKLGLRSHERWTLRPPPSIVNVAPADEPGTVVDAWWDDGWWEGVLIGKEADGKVRVQLPEYNHIVDVSKVRISKDWVNGHWIEMDRADLSGKDLALQCEVYSTSQIFETSQEKIKLPCSDFESDITVAIQSPNVPEKKTRTSEVQEGEFFDYQKWSGKESDSGHGSHRDLCHRATPSRDFLGANGSLQQWLEVNPAGEITIERVMWRMPRKRCRETELLMSARYAKTLFFPVQDPMLNLELDGLQGEEDQSLSWFTENRNKHIDVELKPSRYGHEHVKLLNGSSVGALLLNSLSIANLVMSR